MVDANHRPLIAAANKNGYLYAFDRNNLAAGPIWQDQIATGGAAPAKGQGSASSAVFDGKYLYQAGGSTSIAHVSHPGSVRAIDPTSGRYVWERGFSAIPLAALTISNGELVSPTFTNGAKAGLWVINASSGNVDFTNPGVFFAPATVADGLLFEGDVYGNFTAFQFPSMPGGSARAPASSKATLVRRPGPSRTHLVHRIWVGGR
jgi:hypothetical protein